MRKIILFFFLGLFLIALSFGCKKASQPLDIKGMRYLSINPLGYEEYKHIQTDIVFVHIPGGTFSMGTTYVIFKEDPIPQVTTSDFLIGKYEVTQEQWQKIMGDNPSNFKKGNDYPVEMIAWNDCQKFCQKTGLRLPTETEWEYACRAGTSTKYYWGDSVDNDYLWYCDNSKGTTHPVGQKKPNGFGLYDMSGNVLEWCFDWHGDNYYLNNPEINPLGVSKGQHRVLRGGSCFSRASGSTDRDSTVPNSSSASLGFRAVADYPKSDSTRVIAPPTSELLSKTKIWSAPVEGLRSSLSADKQTYVVDSDPILTYSLQNASDKRIAAVLPSASEDSSFTHLIEFNFCYVGADGYKKYFRAKPKSKGSFGFNPGANDYMLLPTDKTFSASFHLSSLLTEDNQGNKIAFNNEGLYEVIAVYFIRASTPGYGKDLKDAFMWAGNHLTTNPIRFAIGKENK